MTIDIENPELFESRESLKISEPYELVLGSYNGRGCYVIQNTETGVIEAASTILAQAYRLLFDMTMALEKVLEAAEMLEKRDSLQSQLVIPDSEAVN